MGNIQEMELSSCLRHLTPALVGEALLQPVLHWASQEAP
jgi:hypothetical protein